MGALGLQEIRLGSTEGSVYVFAAQKDHFEKAQMDAANVGQKLGFFDYVVAGAGVGLGAGFGSVIGAAAADAALGAAEDLFGGVKHRRPTRSALR